MRPEADGEAKSRGTLPSDKQEEGKVQPNRGESLLFFFFFLIVVKLDSVYNKLAAWVVTWWQNV